MANEISSDLPPQRSSWGWSGRKRRNSESSVSSLRDFVTGRRNSLSSDDTRPNVLRKKAPESAALKSRAPEGKRTNEKVAPVAAAANPSATDPEDAKTARKSQSR